METDKKKVEGAAELVDYDEAAHMLGVPKGTVYGWVHLKAIPHVRLGPRLVRFVRSEIVAWLRERSVEVAR
jgi:excisionase family DNA binding protein